MSLTKFAVIKNAFFLSDFLHKSNKDLLLQSTPKSITKKKKKQVNCLHGLKCIRLQEFQGWNRKTVMFLGEILPIFTMKRPI